MSTLHNRRAAMPDWCPDDLRSWRGRLRLTQAQAAEALCYHVEAYKKLECGTRPIVARVTRLCLLTERDHLRSLYSTSSASGMLQRFATADAVIARHDALQREGKLRSPDGRRRVRHVALFAGMGGAAAAFERIGSDAILLASSDVSSASNALHRFRWPDAPRLGDITEVDWAKLRGLVDLVTFGPPCQSFSHAGKRRGLDDPRGCLVMESLRAIGAMKPQWMVFENVEGFLSFTQAKEEFTSAAGQLGYKLACRVLDTRAFGLPQSRRRVWIVGELASDARGPNAVLDFRQGPRRVKAARGEGWRNPPRRFEGGSGGLNMPAEPDWLDLDSWSGPGPVPVAARVCESTSEPGSVLAVSYRNYNVRTVAPCVQTKSNALNSHPVLLVRQEDGRWKDRRATPTECLRFQGYDDDWLDGPKLGGRGFSDAERARLTGNAWPVPMAAWVLSAVESLFRTERKEEGSGHLFRLRPYSRPPTLPSALQVRVAANQDHPTAGFSISDGRRPTGEMAEMTRD